MSSCVHPWFFLIRFLTTFVMSRLPDKICNGFDLISIALLFAWVGWRNITEMCRLTVFAIWSNRVSLRPGRTWKTLRGINSLVLSKHPLYTEAIKISTILNHWGWVTHICVNNFVSDNDFAAFRRQSITWTNAGLLMLTLSEIMK